MRFMLAAALLLAPAPQDGWQTLKMGDEEIEVYRDAWGIPHIFAKSIAGAFWAEGYCEAQDRIWQMDNFRRAGKGESAELLGEQAVRSDLDTRRNGYTEAELRSMFDAGSERLRAWLTAYTAGVNAFLKAGKLPPQYAQIKQEPRPWTETDCIAIGVMMARRFGEAGDVELQVQTMFSQLEKKFGAEKATVILRDILRDSDPLAPTTLNDHERWTVPKDSKHNLAPRAGEGFADVLREREEVRALRESLGIPAYGGSNAWAIAPKKSATGNPILYGGPMMGFRQPSICDEVHVVAPGLNAAGMSFPGVPGVMIGFNEKLAWTTTSGGADLVDVYSLEFNDAGEYRHNGAWHKIESLEVEIKVAGGASRKETVRRSRYGPMVGKSHTKAMSFWKKEHLTFEAVMDFNVASSVAEFARSIGKVATSHNWFAIDAAGHIGFWYGGAHPKRKAGHDARLPQKGDGSMDWEGLLPVEKWPQSVDPAHGFFANWNNKPSRAWEPSGFGRIFWGRKIIDVLENTEKLTFQQVESIARETAYHDFLWNYFGSHIHASAEGDVAAVLEKYDGVKREGRPEPVLVQKWVEGMMKRVFADELGIAIADRSLQRFLGDPLLYLLDGGGAIKYDFAGGGDLKAMGRDALKDALKDGLDKLAWKDEQVDFKGKAGKVTSAKGRGTFQMTVEMTKDGPRATTLAAPGQCESEDSAHGADQVGHFRDWKYKPFVYRRSEMK